MAVWAAKDFEIQSGFSPRISPSVAKSFAAPRLYRLGSVHRRESGRIRCLPIPISTEEEILLYGNMLMP